MLQFFAGARIEITTLLLESDGHEYLTYILGNKLGLTAKNVRLIIHPSRSLPPSALKTIETCVFPMRMSCKVALQTGKIISPRQVGAAVMRRFRGGLSSRPKQSKHVPLNPVGRGGEAVGSGGQAAAAAKFVTIELLSNSYDGHLRQQVRFWHTSPGLGVSALYGISMRSRLQVKPHPLSSFMRPSLIVNGALIILLGVTNQDRIAALLQCFYSALSSSRFTIPAILAIYGIVLVYLLVSVYRLENTEPPPTRRRKTRLLPYYGREGQLQGWVREEKSQHTPTTSRSERNTTARPSSSRDSLAPIPMPTAAPPAPAPAKEAASLPASAPPRLSEEVPLSTSSLSSWDGFPDGRIRCHFTPQQIEDTSQLAVYWVGDKIPGKQGSPTAATPGKGKVSHFKCAGVIECESKVCITQIAPGADISRQVQLGCTCGYKLHHRSCKSEWSIIRYGGGAVFECTHTHSHSRYTHSLSTPKSKPPQLQSFISRQPVSLISPQPSERLNAERDESPANSVGQVNEGEQAQQHTPEPESKPELVSPQSQVTDLDHEPQREPFAAPQNGVLNSDDERIMDPDAN
ncbi:hypothetical protein R3P38DRAFT_3573346 [Favolaschia claudopus]|uniref:RING-CH-type domain-containing protein n=1 Tax=Favolaschia claudopus TaxID=2862362 RepID=A0AAW0ANN2_9AGAR